MSGPLTTLASPAPTKPPSGRCDRRTARGAPVVADSSAVQGARPTELAPTGGSPLHPPRSLRRRRPWSGALRREAAALAQAPTRLFIGGLWGEAAGGRTLAVEDPATGRVLCQVADADEQDATAALEAATTAQPGWAARPPRERARILRRAAAALEAARERVALVVTREAGKPLHQARAEVDSAVEYLGWNADEALRIGGRTAESPDGESDILVMRRPVGPVLAVTPWNFPLALAARAAAPALAAGCTLVLRPSALTPLSTLLMARILERAGLPAGVLNVVVSATDAVTDPLLCDPRLRKLTFTGSARVGRLLAAQAAPAMLRTSLELGGHAPFIVFADADLEAAVEGAVAAKCRNAGQVCTAASRFYVHRSLVAAFTARLAERMAALRIGPGTKPGVEIGPLSSEAQRTRLHALVQDAIARGARLVCGGEPLRGPGFFYQPTVLADVPAGAALMREEVFGPVAPVVGFARDAEVIALANASDYGLAAYCYTSDLDRALRMGRALEVGMVGINQPTVSFVSAPFGGCKQSGLGRAGGQEGIEEYLETHYLAIGR